MKLSVLDLSPVGVGVAPSRAVRDSIELAVVADALPYERYWFAEHHNMASIATSAPEVLIAAAGAVTRRIRLGAGGMMVPNHAPLHVVEVFRTLEALYPGRIDLGLGRAPGTDPVASAALRRTDDHDQQLAEVFAFEHAQFPSKHPFAKIAPMPSDVRAGELYMLGSTLAGAAIAAQVGLRYAFAGHFAMRQAVDAIARYRSAFRPSPSAERPYAILAVTTVCAATDEEAERLAAPIRLAVVRTRTGQRLPIASVEEALAHTYTPQEQAIVDDFLLGAAIGSPARVAQHLRELATRTGADELMLSTLLPDLATRRTSLELVAGALG